MIKIDKDIPIPSPEERDMIGGKKGPKLKYPFMDMEVGDSFEVLLKDYKDAASLRGSILNSMRRYAKEFKLKSKFITMDTKDGIRVWREK